MRKTKWFQACMAGMISVSMMMTGVSVSAAEFTAPEAAETAEVMEAAETSEEVFDAGEASLDEDTFTAEAAGASEVTINSTAFPDKIFLNHVKTYLDGDKNGKLSAEEINAIRDLRVDGLGISNLKGVEKFTALEELHASGNKLKSVDLTKNKKLTYINLNNNNLTGTLDLSKCTGGLEIIMYNHNSLTKVVMPDKKYLKKVDFIDASYNKFKSQTAAGLAVISSTYLTNCTEINASNNQIAAFNCSGFQGILDISNNKIATLKEGSEGFQAVAIYAEGNTLSKTSSVDFSKIWNRVPQRFSCDSSVKGKIVMVAPKLSASTDWNSIVLTLGSSSENASYTLERKTGNGAYSTIKTWAKGELGDSEFDENKYTDSTVQPGTSYTYKLTATVMVQDRNKKEAAWSKAKTVTATAAPKAPTITVKSSKSKTATISWKQVSGADGYLVYYGTSKTSAKTAVTKGTTKLSVTKTKLTSNKTYYFRVRAYKTIDGKKVYGPFCTAKGVKVK